MAEMSYKHISDFNTEKWFETQEEADAGRGYLHREDGPALTYSDGVANIGLRASLIQRSDLIN